MGDVRIEWHQPDYVYCAVLLRDGEPWFLDGALVGFGNTPAQAVDDLTRLARHLVVEGENFLTERPLTIEDRRWIWGQIDLPQHDDECWRALREAEAAKLRVVRGEA